MYFRSRQEDAQTLSVHWELTVKCVQDAKPGQQPLATTRLFYEGVSR